MLELSAAGLATLITVSSASIVSVLAAIQNSKCTTIRCCCFSCTRKVGDPDDDIVKSDNIDI